MPDGSRLEDLLRQVQKDPASLAFAQLAEEYRRAGRHLESVDACRAGLALHPGYLSARVTLGRALAALGRRDEAERELERVRHRAPDHLTAIRALEELRERRVRERPATDPHAPQARVPEKPVSNATPERTRQTLAALERWLTAIHVTRTQQRA